MSSFTQRAKWRKQHKKRIAADPEKYYYGVLKRNVRARNKRRVAEGKEEIKWDLSLEDFRDFCKEEDYIRKKGVKSKCYHVARIDEREGGPGYTRRNLMTMTNGDNVRYYHMLRYEWDENKRKMVFWHERSKVQKAVELIDENGDIIF